ncbi:hypothetical protein ACFX2F_025446 [Malus domestica]
MRVRPVIERNEEEKHGLLPKYEVNRIKADALARPITVVDPATSEGGKKNIPCLLKRSRLRKTKDFFHSRGFVDCLQACD